MAEKRTLLAWNRWLGRRGRVAATGVVALTITSGCHDVAAPPGSDPMIPAPPLSLVPGFATRVTTDPSTQDYPDVSGDVIVWYDYRPSAPGLYVLDLGQPLPQERRLAAAHVSGPGLPRISGTRVVWSDNGDVYMYDLTTDQEVAITNHPAYQGVSDIDGDRIVWTDHRNADPDATDPLLRFNLDIYLYDLTTGLERPITTAPGNQLNPRINGDRVVWYDQRDQGLNMYDLSTDVETALGVPGSGAAIFEDRIAYGCWNGGTQLCVLDLNSGLSEQLTSGSPGPDKIGFDISREFVVWIDNRNDPDFGQGDLWDVYAYDLNRRAELRVTRESTVAFQSPAWISGNQVVWVDVRNGDRDIYAYAIPRHTGGPGGAPGGPPGGSPPAGPPGGSPPGGPPGGGM